MQSHPSLICLLFLLAFTSYHVSAAVVLDGEMAKKLETDLFELPSTLKDEVVTETGEEGEDEEEFFEDLDEGDKRRDVLVQAGWRRIRRRISGAFRRAGDGIRRVFRKPWKVFIGHLPHGGWNPGLLNA
ncbi:hypothetical protein TSMEX_000378 [Taenia solium]|eukprot:TsM_001234600 transcript=TsM_001234600 gene=TsM_001234600